MVRGLREGRQNRKLGRVQRGGIDPRMSLGQGAGFVKDHHIDLGQPFKCGAVFDQ